MALLVTAGMSVALVSPASAALSPTGVGPIDPATNFPAYYTDTNGLSLDLCLGLPNCLADTDLVQIHADGGDAEAFYYAADATTTNFTVHLALEAAYAAEGPDQEVVFQRTQLTARDGGLVPGTVYRITDPYGSYNCTVEDDGAISQNGCRIETTPVERDFGRALNGRLGPFLTVDPTEPPPPPGYIGDNVTPRKVIGSPTGFNAFRVQGPGLSGTCTNPDGSTVSSCEQTDRFILQGRIANTLQPAASVSQGTLDFGDVPATPAPTRTLTYANIGSLPVAIGSIALGGTNAGAFAQTNDCPATLAAGSRCSITVTFTPEAGRSSTATLTITDDTPALTRTVTLRGSNLPRMVVADPVPPAALAFGNQQINASSPELNVVIGNTGNGPLTVASAALTGASATHFRLGTNGCATPVPADSGCEIGVVFRPTTLGGKSANLRVTDSNGAIVNVPLTGSGVNSDPTPPTAPTLSGSRTGTTANLSWTAATDNVGVTGYEVLRNGTPVTTLGSTSRTFADTDLAPGTYTYTVRARDGAGNASASSNTVTIVVPAPDTTAPTASTLSGSVTGSTANLNWTAATDNVGVTAYQVLRNGVQQGANLAATARTFSQTGLAAGTYSYTVRALDAAGNATTSNAVSLTVAAVNPPPTVTARTPAVNATAVAVGANVTATFSEAVQGVTTATFVLRPAATPTAAPIAGTVTRSGTTNQWILNPNANLARDTRYTVTLTGGAGSIRDLAGAALTSVSWSFTTGPAPTVTARTPAAGALGVSRTVNVTATFSERLTSGSVSLTTVRLTNTATGTVIPAVMSWNLSTLTVTLNPNATLAANTQFTVQLIGGATGIRDLAGNPLATTSWTFRTGA